MDGGRLAGALESKEHHGSVLPGLLFFLLHVFLKEPKKPTNQKYQETEKNTQQKLLCPKEQERDPHPPSRTGP